jgi:hypothetical protein
MSIVQLQHALFVSHNVGESVLSADDRKLLKKYGIEIPKEYTPFEQAFYFGTLAGVLRTQTGKVTYSDFKKQLLRGWFPLTTLQKNALEGLKNRAYTYVKDLGQRIGKFVQEKAQGELLTATLLKEEITDAVQKNKSVRDLVSDIGSKTGDWNRDLGRIAETEMQNAFQTGMLTSIIERYGEDSIVYKEVYAGACKHCVELYLTNGYGSQPRLFRIPNLLKNGTNVGRKAKDWLPVLDAVHPFCRCQLQYLDRGKLWDGKKFAYPKSLQEEARKLKGTIKIKIGDKEFAV